MITPLSEVPGFIDELSELHAAEWKHLYRNWDARAAKNEFLNHKADGSLPATLVLLEEGRLAGSVSVIFDDFPDRSDLNPWLASLYVLPQWRGRGCGLKLVSAALDLARDAGADRLYVFTEAAELFFQRFGFEILERREMNKVPVVVLSKMLD